MKGNKKGAFKALAAYAGGFIGGALQNKVLPMIPGATTINPYITANAGAAVGFAALFFLKKPNDIIEGLSLGAIGNSGGQTGHQAGIYGIMDSQILLDAFKPSGDNMNGVDDAENMRALMQENVSAAADFNSSIAAAADFNSSIMGSENEEERY